MLYSQLTHSGFISLAILCIGLSPVIVYIVKVINQYSNPAPNFNYNPFAMQIQDIYTLNNILGTLILIAGGIEVRELVINHFTSLYNGLEFKGSTSFIKQINIKMLIAKLE